MAGMVERQYPIGQRAELSGHFAEPVVLEAVPPIGGACECRVRLQDGTPDEAIRTREEVVALMQRRVEGAPRLLPGEVLLLTATSHHGDDDRSAHFIRLIEPGHYPRTVRAKTPVGFAAIYFGWDLIACERFDS